MKKFKVSLYIIFYEEEVEVNDSLAAMNKVWDNLDQRIDTINLKMEVKKIEGE